MGGTVISSAYITKFNVLIYGQFLDAKGIPYPYLTSILSRGVSTKDIGCFFVWISFEAVIRARYADAHYLQLFRPFTAKI